MQSSKEFSMNKKSRIFIFVSFALLILVLLVSLWVGAAKLSFTEVCEGLANPNSTNGRILYQVRIPRIIATTIAGMALAVSGLLIQKILHNPLASPNIIGVNSGALFGVVLLSSILPGLTGIIAIVPAFIGAILATLIIYLISKKCGFTKTTLILSGIAINAMFQAMVDFILEINPNALPYSQAFRVGGADGVTLSLIWPFAIVIGVGILLAFLMSSSLDIYGLGDEVSQSLGLNVKLSRFFGLGLASLLAAAAVSFMGLLGFVGLIVPHVVKIFCKDKTKEQLLGSILFGGFFLTFCDMIARTCFSPYEIPVGILLSFIGGPFFIILLIWRKKV